MRYRISGLRMLFPPFLSVKAGSGHTAARFLVLHECPPDEPRAVIFRHYHRDPQIDPEDGVVVPTGQRIKGVHVAVVSPGPAVPLTDVTQNFDALGIEKHQ